MSALAMPFQRPKAGTTLRVVCFATRMAIFLLHRENKGSFGYLQTVNAPTFWHRGYVIRMGLV